LLYVLMSKLALPRVRSIIDTRQKRMDDDLAEAGRLKSESETAMAAYEKALADARANAQAIANQTREKQAAEAEARRKMLEDDLNRKLAAAEKSIAATKHAAMSNVRGIAEDATRVIVERLIGAAPSEQAVAQAVAEVLKG
jgi:F-type H+-transporting ATPase subunit b